MAEIGFDIINAKSSARANRSPLRHRPLGRASTYCDTPSSLKNRTTSTFSDSVDEVRQSLFSSTDDLLLPRARNSKIGDQGEQSVWQSAPLALALLPAVGGLLFHNGGSVVTDITLLTLAAIFLNWSVRLPWDWYHAAQSTPSPYPLPPRDPDFGDTVIEESSNEEKQNSTPKMAAQDDNLDFTPSKLDKDRSQQKSDARSELRIHELLALFSCFLFPIVGAWLLHTIRAQLSRPSEGLVSNYNLTIFILASEIRPISHLIKMIQARTLYLQRSIHPPDDDATPINTPNLLSLTSRLDDLEAHISAASAEENPNNPFSKTNTSKITHEVRKSVQPDLDALNRAVRRYEKRATLLTMQTESRLQDLEARMSDAITLAAAAERSSNAQTAKRGSSALILLDWICAIVVLPVQAAWTVLSMPARAAASVMGSVEGYVGKKVKREMKTAGKATAGGGGKGADRKGAAAAAAAGVRVQGRGTKKAM